MYDDASPDGSAGIVEGFDDPRLRFVRNRTNLGAEGNWNRCLENVNGSYFLLVPGDDLLDPEYLARKVAVFQDPANEDVVLVGCDRTIIDRQDRVFMKRRFPGSPGVHNARGVIRKIVRKGTNVIGEPGAALVRADVALKVGSYRARPGYLIDADFWVRVLQFGDYYNLAEPLCSFRVSNDSWSARIGLRQYREFKEFLDHMQSEKLAPFRRIDFMMGEAMALVNLCGRVAVFKLMS